MTLTTPQYFALTLTFAVMLAMLATIATAHKPVAKDQAALAAKADREPLIIRTIPISKPGAAAAPLPIKVATELPPPDAPPFKERDLLEPSQEPKIHRLWRRRHFAEHGGICRRHGLHKVASHSGKSWHCR